MEFHFNNSCTGTGLVDRGVGNPENRHVSVGPHHHEEMRLEYSLMLNSQTSLQGIVRRRRHRNKDWYKVTASGSGVGAENY